MHPRRLRLLVELAHHGTMRAVADVTGTATSAVSQQLAVLEAEAGTRLLERTGRTVRLTPAGRRLVGHARGVLAALDVARADLAEDAEPAGVVRVAAFASALAEVLVPATGRLSVTHPALRLELQEREPDEVLELLHDDRVDLGVTYDFDLAPRPPAEHVTAQPLWPTRWALAVPAGVDVPAAGGLAAVRALADRRWIANSRGADDEEVIDRLAALAGVRARIGHLADSLALVQDMVAADLGIGLLPTTAAPHPGVRLHGLHDPPVVRRAYAVTGPGRDRWPPVALVRDLLAAHRDDASGGGSATAG